MGPRGRTERTEWSKKASQVSWRSTTKKWWLTSDCAASFMCSWRYQWLAWMVACLACSVGWTVTDWSLGKNLGKDMNEWLRALLSVAAPDNALSDKMTTHTGPVLTNLAKVVPFLILDNNGLFGLNPPLSLVGDRNSPVAISIMHMQPVITFQSKSSVGYCTSKGLPKPPRATTALGRSPLKLVIALRVQSYSLNDSSRDSWNGRTGYKRQS